MEATAPNADEDRRKKKRRFFLIRVSILLFILFVVVLYALRDLRSRRARKDWDKTLDVAVVLLHVSGTTPVTPEAVRALSDRTDALELRLADEARRYRGASTIKPFRLKVFGPVEMNEAPPSPASDSPVDLAKQTIDLERWLREIDPRAGVVADHWDTRIYVTIRGPESELRSFVEGQSQQDGRIGTVSVELDPSMADLTLIVVAHELMHTLGASDKYDPSTGRTRIPDGLAEPTQNPQFPQRFAEIMARNRPLTSSTEALPLALDEMMVGPITAKEIGWVR